MLIRLWERLQCLGAALCFSSSSAPTSRSTSPKTENHHESTERGHARLFRFPTQTDTHHCCHGFTLNVCPLMVEGGWTSDPLLVCSAENHVSGSSHSLSFLSDQHRLRPRGSSPPSESSSSESSCPHYFSLIVRRRRHHKDLSQ